MNCTAEHAKHVLIINVLKLPEKIENYGPAELGVLVLPFRF
jgi:hypothetical protein